MDEGSFSREIEAHLELQRQNSRLERRMPIERYRERFAPPPELAVHVADPPSEPSVGYPAPWDDPDSWWNPRDGGAPGFEWRR